MGTDHQSTGFISSQQTEHSERQQHAINLGKALVEELKLEPGVDTLSRWVAHYITEQVAIADSATGEEKAEAEKRCFDSIMKLWEHRYALPNERSPFKDFMSIFATLQQLDPESQKPFYFDWKYQGDQLGNENPSDVDGAKSWLKMALGIDRTARILIETALRQAAGRVINSSARTLLKQSPESPQDFDIQVIMKLIGNLDADDELYNQNINDGSKKPTEYFLNTLSKEALEERIKYLELFIESASVLRSAFKEQLGESV